MTSMSLAAVGKGSNPLHIHSHFADSSLDRLMNDFYFQCFDAFEIL